MHIIMQYELQQQIDGDAMITVVCDSNGNCVTTRIVSIICHDDVDDDDRTAVL